MNNWCFVGLFLCLIVACQKSSPTQERFSYETSLIDSLGNQYEKVNRFSGTILVAQNDTVLYHSNFGKANYADNKPFNRSTAFKIGALSEWFTANIIQKMVSEGRLDGQAKVADYLPAVRHEFTINDLLYHQSGLPTVESIKESHPSQNYATITFVNLADLDSVATKSDLGYNLLGLLIEELTQTSFQNALETELADKQLLNTYYQRPDTNTAQGYTGFKNYRNQGLELQSSSDYLLEEMYSSKGIKSTAIDILQVLEDVAEAYTFGYLKNDGFSYCLSKEQTGQTIIVLSNFRHPVAEEMVQSIQAICLGRTFELPLLRKKIAVDPAVLKDYAGIYEVNPSFTFEVSYENDDLFFFLFGEKNRILPQATDQFYLESSDAAMRFTRDSAKSVNGVILYDGFLEGQFIEKIK